MGSFKENLKSELEYKGILIKDLAALSGMNRRTIDNYLSTHNSIPTADAAVSIAQVLGVSVGRRAESWLKSAFPSLLQERISVAQFLQ